MHYIITKGGSAANIVPDFAELSLIVRHPDRATLEGIWERVRKCAEAGALATETRVEIEIGAAYSSYLPNETLLGVVDQSLHWSGGVTYDDKERDFAEKLRTTLSGPLPPLSMAAEIRPVRTALLSGSTDVGDVSWVTPTGQFFAATFPPGVPLHTWQSTACAGMSIGQKGMLVAAKTLALSAIELFSDPA